MVKLEQGVIVPVKFPFSDLTRSKRRPALVLAESGKDDWMLCQITSKAYADHRAIVINQNDFCQGSLSLISYARPGKLFTAHQNLLETPLGTLSDDKYQEIIESIIALLKKQK